MNSGSLNRPTLVTAWPRKPNNRVSVVQRIQALTQELEKLQSEMHSQLTVPSGKSNSLLEDAEAVEAINHFKAELDQMRRILRFYIDQAARKRVPVSDQQQSKTKKAEAQRMLPLQPNNHSLAAQPAWYFDRLDLVIESYMQRKPASAESKPISRKDTKAFS